MENTTKGLFEDAQYGDRYRTRNGRRAIYLNNWGNPAKEAILHVQGLGLENFSLEGRRFEQNEDPFDITERCEDGNW